MITRHAIEQHANIVPHRSSDRKRKPREDKEGKRRGKNRKGERIEKAKTILCSHFAFEGNTNSESRREERIFFFRNARSFPRFMRGLTSPTFFRFLPHFARSKRFQTLRLSKQILKQNNLTLTSLTT